MVSLTLSTTVLLVLIHLVSSRSILSNDPYYGQPEQIHLSYGRKWDEARVQRTTSSFRSVDPSLMIVTWVTLNEVNDSVVEYGALDTLEQRATGWVSVFQDSGNELRREYVHRVVLRDLIPGRKYCKWSSHAENHFWSVLSLVYHCGSDEYGWSSLFWFTAMRNDSEFVVRAAVYGDMGADNAQSLTRLQEETQRGHFDLILHVGEWSIDRSSMRIRRFFSVRWHGLWYEQWQCTCRRSIHEFNPIHCRLYSVHDVSRKPWECLVRAHLSGRRRWRSLDFSNFSQYTAKFSMPSSLTTYGGNANHFYRYLSRCDCPDDHPFMRFRLVSTLARCTSLAFRLNSTTTFSMVLNRFVRNTNGSNKIWKSVFIMHERGSSTITCRKRINLKIALVNRGSSPWRTDRCTAAIITTMNVCMPMDTSL